MSRPAAAPFPWADIMVFGLGVLHWSPKAFWNATPRELAAAMTAHGARMPLAATSRAMLAALMAAHPDR